MVLAGLRNRRLTNWVLTLFAMLSAVAASIAIYSYYFGGPTYSAQINLLVVNQLINSGPEISGQDIQILVEGQTVSMPTSYSFIFRNNGSEPIRETDIDVPLTVMFESAVPLKILATESHPAGVKPSISISNAEITVRHGLLNPGNSIEFTVLADGYEQDPQVVFRSLRIDGPQYTTGSSVDGDQRVLATPIILSVIGIMFLLFAAMMIFMMPIMVYVERRKTSWFLSLISKHDRLKIPASLWASIRLRVSKYNIETAMSRSLARVLERFGLRYSFQLAWLQHPQHLDNLLMEAGVNQKTVEQVRKDILDEIVSVLPREVANAYKYNESIAISDIVEACILRGFSHGKIDIFANDLLDEVDRYIVSQIVRPND